MAILEDLATGKMTNKTQRYACLRRMVSAKYQPKAETLEALIAKEKARDFSDADRMECLALEACNPDFDNKMKLIKSYAKPGEWKQFDFKASAPCLYNGATTQEKERLADAFFLQLRGVAKNFHMDYLKVYFTALVPTFLGRQSDLSALYMLEEQLENNKDQATLKKLVKQERDHLETVTKIQNSVFYHDSSSEEEGNATNKKESKKRDTVKLVRNFTLESKN